MKLNDNSQRYKDARQIMSEKLADSRKESAAEKAASQITAKFHSLISKSIWDE